MTAKDKELIRKAFLVSTSNEIHAMIPEAETEECREKLRMARKLLFDIEHPYLQL